MEQKWNSYFQYDALASVRRHAKYVSNMGLIDPLAAQPVSEQAGKKAWTFPPYPKVANGATWSCTSKIAGVL